MEQKRSWGKQNEPPPTTPKASLHPKKVMCIWWDWKGALYYELLLENQMINSNKCCSRLDQLKAALSEKRLELVNRKRIILYQDKHKTSCFFDDLAKTVWLGWEVLIHPLYSPDIVPSISTDFGLYKIFLMEKVSISWKTAKGTWNSSLLKKIKSFRKVEL